MTATGGFDALVPPRPNRRVLNRDVVRVSDPDLHAQIGVEAKVRKREVASPLHEDAAAARGGADHEERGARAVTPDHDLLAARPISHRTNVVVAARVERAAQINRVPGVDPSRSL